MSLKLAWPKGLITRLRSFSPKKRKREKYIQICLKGNRQRIRTVNYLEVRLRLLMDQVVSLMRNVVQITGAKKQVKLELDGLTSLIRKRSRKSANEFDELLEVPEVNRLEFEPGIIRVITAPIAIEQSGYRYELGYFAIEIVNNAEIIVRNLYNKGEDKTYDHPQIKNGYINLPLHLRVPLAKLIISLEYADVVQVIVNILKSYNPNQCYIALEKNWKGVPI